jgi:hypothetical protein
MEVEGSTIFVGACALIVTAALFVRWMRPWIYDVIIIQMTKHWYRAVLQRIEAGSHVLDVGIGVVFIHAENPTRFMED